MAADRITKFYEDSQRIASTLIPRDVVVSKATTAKTVSELSRLRTWLQKHQNETVPDGAKIKLFMTLEIYHRVYSTKIYDAPRESPTATEAAAAEVVGNAVTDLLGDYLQLPEGRLLSAKDKKKVLVWYQALSQQAVDGSSSSSSSSSSTTNTKNSSSSTSGTSSRWTVMDINEDESLSLLREKSTEDWRENVSILFNSGVLREGGENDEYEQGKRCEEHKIDRGLSEKKGVTKEGLISEESTNRGNVCRIVSMEGLRRLFDDGKTVVIELDDANDAILSAEVLDE